MDKNKSYCKDGLEDQIPLGGCGHGLIPSYFDSYFSLATVDISALPEYQHQIETCLKLYPHFASYLTMRAQILNSPLERETLMAMIEKDEAKVERGIKLILKRRLTSLKLVPHSR